MNLLNWNIFNGTRQLAGFKAWLLAWITSSNNNNKKNSRHFSEIFNFPFEPPFCLAKTAKAALQFGAFVGQVKGNTHSANMDTQHTHTCRWEERRQEGACVLRFLLHSFFRCLLCNFQSVVFVVSLLGLRALCMWFKAHLLHASTLLLSSLLLQQEVARPMTKPEQRSTGRQARKPVGIGCTVVEQAEAVTGTEAETVAGTRHTHAHTQGRATGRDRLQRLQFLNVAAAASALSQHDNNNNNNDKYLCVSFRFHFAASYNELCCHTSHCRSPSLSTTLPLS